MTGPTRPREETESVRVREAIVASMQPLALDPSLTPCELERVFSRPEFEIEAAVFEVIVAANALGLPTRSSCEGHGLDQIPYVMFGFDYGDSSPDDAQVAELRESNRSSRVRVEELVAAFNEERRSPRSLRIVIENGTSEQEMRELRARFWREREALRRTDPGKLASVYNYRQFEDTFSIHAGRDGLLPALWLPWRHRLLARRQAEMRAFGAFLRAVLAAAT